MNAYAPYFPFRTEHIGMLRCQVVRDFAASNQIYCRECVIAEGSGKSTLRKLDVVLSQGLVNHIFESLSDYLASSSVVLRMAMQPYESDAFCLHIYCENDSTLLSMIWRYESSRGGRTEFQLEHVYALGFPRRDPVDMAFDYIDVLRSALAAQNSPLDLHHDSQKGTLSFDVAAAITSYMAQQTSIHAVVSGGKTTFRVEKDRFLVTYDICTGEVEANAPSLVDIGQRKVRCTRFYSDFDNDIEDWNGEELESKSDDWAFISSDPSSEMGALLSTETSWSIMEQIRAYGMRASHGDENWLLSSGDDGDISLSSSMKSFDEFGVSVEKSLSVEEVDSQCPTIEAIHRAALVHEKIAPEVAKLALDEVTEHLPIVMRPPFIYMLHLWAPELGDIIRLEVLAISSEDDDFPVLVDVLMNIYYYECNYTMLLALLQRMINNNTFSPHSTIRYGLEYVNILSQELSMYSMAVKKLDVLKMIVQKHGNSNEITAYALACHRAQHSGAAIQFLHSMMKRAQTPQEIAQIGLVQIHIMLEHNEPMQTVINVCKRILVDNPRQMDSLEIMAQCYERSKMYEDAADAYQQCFDYYVQEWESKCFETQAKDAIEEKEKSIYMASKLTRIAEKLEELYDMTGNHAFKCIVLQQHIRFEPSSKIILSKLLKALEEAHSYHEMVQVSTTYLNENPAINKDDEIAIRLTLYNIYECALHLSHEADQQLIMARQIGPDDARVISADIDRCRKYGLKEEEIGHRLALIDVLPAKDSIDETLSLVRQYEALHVPIERIIDLLRRVNGRAPNNPLILLELRQYLRKNGQSFELATVLEKLARVTADLQTRKSILLEASEVHEKLGNHQVSQALYHEAQLCSPINPNANAALMNDKIRTRQRLVELEHQKGQGGNMLSALAAVVLTSKSLSVVGDAVDTATPRADRTHSGTGDVSGLVRLATLDAPLATLDAPRSEECKCVDNAPIEEQILDARLRGNTNDLLTCLLKSIEDIDEAKRPARVLQEIGCIYLYDKHDNEMAQKYLEQASALDEAVSRGEQTLNALENIYQSLHKYRKLAQVLEKKVEISTIAEERRRNEIRLAQIRYEHLGENGQAIDTMRRILEQNPENETALQLLAQIYIDTQQIDKAIEALTSVSSILEPNSKQMAQHMLRIIALYIESDRIDDAKRELRKLFDTNDYVDKLAVIEHYKRICRERDEWEEQLDLLRDELAYYLGMEKSSCNVNEVLLSCDERLLLGVAEHTLREYADVCYYKLQRIEDAVEIYAWLYRRKPDDSYAKRVLIEMHEQYPDNDAVKSKCDDLCIETTDQDVLLRKTPKEASSEEEDGI